VGKIVKNGVNLKKYAPAYTASNTYVLQQKRGDYRRTTTGYGRTKKPGLHGTVKNPRLLKAFAITMVICSMSEFFDIFNYLSKEALNLLMPCK
jgi:hypothetical protein